MPPPRPGAAGPVRFAPPRGPLSPAAAWCVRRALGPAGGAAQAPVDATAALAAARALGVVERLAARMPVEAAAVELGAAAADELRLVRRGAAAAHLSVEALCAELADLAAAAGNPLVLLKGAALLVGGLIAPGSRGIGDIDVLSTPAGAVALASQLRGRGWSQGDLPPGEAHLPQLVLPGRGVVEVHTVLRGVRLDGRAADAAAVLRAGLTDAAPGMPEACRLPARRLMLSHLLVHGIGQHGLAGTYPLLRMIGDLQDLAPKAGEEPDAEAFGWVAADLRRPEADGALELARRLAEGDDVLAIAAEDGAAGRILRHAVAAVEDEGYRRSLRWEWVFGETAAVHGRWRGLARTVWRSLALNDAQVEAIYGRPASRAGYWRRRVLRPFDLLRRLALALRDRAAYRRRMTR